MPRVLNKKIHGVPAGAVLVDRTTKLGNPFTHLPIGKTTAKVEVESIDEAVRCFKLWEIGSNEPDEEKREQARDDLIEILHARGRIGDWEVLMDVVGPAPSRLYAHTLLRGKDLVCWCVKADGTGPCHAHHWLKIANS